MKSQDGHQRFEKSLAVLDRLGNGTPATDRLAAAMEEFNDFKLTGASEPIRQSVESFGLQYNRLMKAAQEAAGDEAASLSEPEAAELVTSLRATCELTRSVESERILSPIRESDGPFPAAELNLIRRYREWFEPILLQECIADTEKLEHWNRKEMGPADDDVSSVGFFMLYLASEWELAEFLPVVLRGLKLPGELPSDLYGDAIHEQVPRLLAQFIPEDLDRIDAIVLDGSLNLYVRWGSVTSYKYLVRDKVLTLEAAVRRLDHLFEATKVTDDTGRPGMGHEYELSAGIVEVIASIGGGELSTIGDSPEQWKYIDDTIIYEDEFVSSVAPTDPSGLTPGLRRLPPTRIEDCVNELRNGPWSWETENDSSPEPRPPIPKPSLRPQPSPRVTQVQPQVAATTVTKSDRIPRNADCPCGSGKKYKKCCLRT
jgi:hypothetical protein